MGRLYPAGSQARHGAGVVGFGTIGLTRFVSVFAYCDCQLLRHSNKTLIYCDRLQSFRTALSAKKVLDGRIAQVGDVHNIGLDLTTSDSPVAYGTEFFPVK